MPGVAATEHHLRREVVRALCALAARGLNRGTSGNVSARWRDGMLITPTGLLPERVVARSIVFVGAAGTPARGALRPSSEWRMHQRIYQRRPDAQAIVHCHSRFATVLASAERPILSVHYMAAIGGRSTIPLARYAPFGSAELADAAVESLAGGNAVLLAHHGQIALGPTVERALVVAEEVEELAAVYWGTLALGAAPPLLSEAQMTDVLARFATYGQQAPQRQRKRR